MMFIFDTSSFVSMARYYLPFDSEGKIYQHVKLSIKNRRIILIDAVLNECKYVAKKVVIKKLDFLYDKNFLKINNTPIKTENIIPASPAKFYNMVDNNFATPRKRILSDIEFEKEKQAYLNSADARMIMYAYNYKHDNPDEKLFLVTEESGQANDNKVFKKLPTICKQLDIPCMALPEYLDMCDDLNMSLG